MTSETKTQFNQPFLDGLRGVAVLMVLFVHASLKAGGMAHFSGYMTRADALSRGVQLFFILSAFMITLSMERHWPVDKRPVLSFFARRAFRILPLWWAVCLLHYFYDQRSVHDLLASMFFYFGFMTNAWQVCVVSVGWSLFTEEFFYALYPVIFKVTGTLKRAASGLAVALAVSFLWRWSVGAIGIDRTFLFDQIFPLNDLYCFFIGLFIFRLWPHVQNRNDRWIDIAVLVAWIYLILAPSRMAGSVAVSVFLFAGLFENSLWRRFLETRVLRAFGVSCYSIYLLQLIVMEIMVPYWRQAIAIIGFGESAREVQTLLLFVPLAAICLAVGALSHRWLEVPIIQYGRGKIANWNSQTGTRPS